MVTRRKNAQQASAGLGEEPATPGAAFPVVGIGASAGGLAALELFLRQVPPACGLAFVIVQHLDPTHKAALAELLQRVTAMPVMEIQDRMFATDLEHDAIDKARAGAYPANIAADVPEERLRRFFTQEERGYKVNQEIREMVVFAEQNLVIDPPFTRLDLLSCRNLLIYLDADLQKKLLPLFHYSLNPGGILVLGSSETIGAASDLFAPLPGKTRLYRRRENPLRTTPVEFPLTDARIPGATAGSRSLPPLSASAATRMQAETDALLLRRFAPAAVLTTDKGDLVYISGKTGKYLEPAAGKANLNLFAMAREGLGGALSGAFAKALREGSAVILKDVVLEIGDAGQHVNVTIQPLSEPAVLRGMVLVVFADIATLFLDEQLRVRRFTKQTAGIIKLIPGDAGRPLTDLASELDYPSLADDAREVLRSLVCQERQAAARDGRWFMVRITQLTGTDRRGGDALPRTQG